MARKQNCWDFNRCGRESGGSRSSEMDICPASTVTSCTGLNNGKNAGRLCWAIAGTFSSGKVRGVFAKELSCLNCDFLKLVCKEEGICNAELLSSYDLYNDKSRMFGRREYMRIDFHLDITLKTARGVSGDIIGVTSDFSREGFSFVSENFNLDPKETIKFRIKHPTKNTFVYALGRVAWKRQIRDRCLAGVKLREMDKDILNYAYNRWIDGIQFH